ncbi:hypothetical protein HRR83_005271 [Exophiala dermatitidis]|uniref:Tyrosine specific protein phosphatases domain-containing protein n=2 Tax=Exophiala dermatitidis TaxID=5970 RepID=H6C1Z1_EXODN|nr:uncharacterized protein HMPREF1120_05841 [Exophiala dermatitidis NIH/UT8656]KAJ4515966.1 hypothetical protein HRR74_005123 [Exophiala dermatitidis]EHY57817.1 hypothetical protein HMPREF1120_05841 [Exophiala dermatitidis NIH/UT8656]KAJ4518628.1 hypothetical protein HRR73_004209 [Exophiala dermatitidis]KAJ4534141.1 hypothetical protein HRR76_006075 [Exophiala dermatitidis]KAJ4550294.1 hypothetical protein HRR77_003761 [Exophiala dermatitidis]
MTGTSNHVDERMTGYMQSFPYSDKRLFESPRVQIPPPALDYSHGKPRIRVSSAPFEHASGQYGDPTFLRALTNFYDLNMRHTMLSWRYEMRRTAQVILPFLYIGPSSAARDSEFIKTTGITLLVAVRNAASVKTRPSFLDPARFSSGAGISTLTFDFESPYDFIRNVRGTIKAMNDHLTKTCIKTPPEDVHDVAGKVLIFCESGNDRSPVMVAAYLMVVFGVSAVSAIHMIQSQRFSITMSDEMKNVLMDFQEIIEAERQVSSFNSSLVSSRDPPNHQQASSLLLPYRPSKRNLDDVYESEEDFGPQYQQSPQLGLREGIAPFTDLADRI